MTTAGQRSWRWDALPPRAVLTRRVTLMAALGATALLAFTAALVFMRLIPISQPTDWMFQRMPITVAFTLVTTSFVAVLAVGLAPTVARHGARMDRVVSLVVLAGHVIPAIWVGIVLSSAVIDPSTLPVAIVYVPIGNSVSGWLLSITVPAAILSVGCGASVTRHFVHASRGALDSDMVNTLRSRGLSIGYILRAHVLPRALPTATTLLALHFLGLLTGILILETVVTAQPGGFSSSATLPEAPNAILSLALIVVLAAFVHLGRTLIVTVFAPQRRHR